MTTPDRILQLEAENLLRLAQMLGMNIEITNRPLRPLAQGHTTPSVQIWPKRELSIVPASQYMKPLAIARERTWPVANGEPLKVMSPDQVEASLQAVIDRSMSDREWAAISALFDALAQPAPVQEPAKKLWLQHGVFPDLAGFDANGLPRFYSKESADKFQGGQCSKPLKAGLLLLVSDPDGFRKHDSPNGWGLYIHFLPFVTAVLMACIEYPDADVRACT